MDRFLEMIDGANEWTGRASSYLILPMVGVVIYEVVMRRLFNAPTTWAFDMTTFIYGIHFMLGLGYVMLYDRHVRIDVIAQQFPPKVQLWLRIITFWILFFPYIAALTFASVEFAIDSWAMWEVGQNTWRPPIYPIKSIIPIATTLLLFQGFSNFVKDVRTLKGEK